MVCVCVCEDKMDIMEDQYVCVCVCVCVCVYVLQRVWCQQVRKFLAVGIITDPTQENIHNFPSYFLARLKASTPESMEYIRESLKNLMNVEGSPSEGG